MSLHLCSSILGAASLASFTLAGLQSLSATADALGLQKEKGDIYVFFKI